MVVISCVIVNPKYNNNKPGTYPVFVSTLIKEKQVSTVFQFIAHITAYDTPSKLVNSLDMKKENDAISNQ